MMHSNAETPVSTPQPPSGRKRPRARASPPTTGAGAAVHVPSDGQTIAIASMTGFFVLIAWFAHSALDEFHRNGGGSAGSNHPLDLMMRRRPKEAPAPKPRRALLFAPLGGQGFGNVVNGLLSAHMLADEYDRIVCVDPKFESFLRAFRPYHTDDEAAWCQKQWDERIRHIKTCKIVNFSAGTLNECTLRECLNHEGPVELTSNTYPRWAHVSKGYFATHYQPTPLLEAILPWGKDPPDVVVHLRKEDGKNDKREGLDEETFHALGKMLPKDTFLVTNKVEWYAWFKDNYGWRNSAWFEVRHSILKKTTWGNRGVGDQQGVVETMVTNKLNITVDVLHDLTMHSDWLTIAAAKEKVLHTHSDFSLSAVHWMNKESKTIMGMREATSEDVANHEARKVGDKVLNLIDEEWYRDGETPRLIDRTVDMLKNCKDEQIEELRRKEAREALEKKSKRRYVSIGDDDNPLLHVDLPEDLQTRFESRQYAYFNPRTG